MVRIGVFVCHCGTNIGGIVNVPQVAEYCRDLPYVKLSTEYKYLCSEPGQNTIKNAVAEYNLTHIVIGSCSPRMHEKTFQATLKSCGLNPHMLHVVNLREHCSWVHKDKDEATSKAISLMEAGIARVAHNMPLFTQKISLTKRALVIGGGIAGIQVALDIADAGHEVILVESASSIGGRMAQLDKTFPTLDCSACILTPKMVEAASHPLITLKTYSQVEHVSGSVGNFNVTIREKARYVSTACTGCGDCWKACPTKVTSEFNETLDKRKAIYIPFPQAIPMKAVIDKAHCAYFKTGKCRRCEKVCGAQAIDFDMQDKLIEYQIGTIVVATGYDLFDPSVYGEYGKGLSRNVISSMQLERFFSSSGPVEGNLIYDKDHKPQDIVMIQCVGSRDEKKGKTYCSKICCMYTAKHTLLLKEKLPDANIYVFYMDLRTAGKNYEEFLQRAQAQPGVNYIRGRVSKLVKRPDNKVKVVGVDTLLGETIEIEADLVVLATGVVAKPDTTGLSQVLGIPVDKDQFFIEAHPKLRPVETHTAGIFLAGACQGPKDIPETVALASGAAAKAIGILSKAQLESQPMTALVADKDCASCFLCMSVCPFNAIDKKVYPDGVTKAVVKEEICQGCGTCVSACRGGCLTLRGYNDAMIFSEVLSLCQ